MDYLVYGYYILLLVLLFWGVRFFGRNKWNDEFLSLTQMKALQGFCAVCIMLHHLGQKTCAPWLERMYIVHGLDVFVPIGYLFVSVFLFCSGYGLYISVKKKPNYLDHFLSRRVLLVVLSFYSTGLIFLVARFLVGKRMDLPHFIYFVTGIQLSNPNAWFVIALPIFYVGFYLAFKYCKKENNAIYLTCLVVFIYTLIGTFTDHNDWWMRGEWWYNSVHLFSVGLLFAKFKDTIVAKVKKHYVIVLVLTLIGFVAFYEISGIAQNVVSYYGEDYNHSFKVLRRWICLLAQSQILWDKGFLT